MRRLNRVLASVTLVGVIALGGVVLTRQVLAVAGEANAERLNRAVLGYIGEKNPLAPIKAFQRFPEVLVAEAERTKIDHCLALAQAEVESEFKHDAVGGAGEVGLFQTLPSTAALFESTVGPFKRPVLKGQRDLGDLAIPTVSTQFAMAYLRDIMTRKPSIYRVAAERASASSSQSVGAVIPARTSAASESRAADSGSCRAPSTRPRPRTGRRASRRHSRAAR